MLTEKKYINQQLNTRISKNLVKFWLSIIAYTTN